MIVHSMTKFQHYILTNETPQQSFMFVPNQNLYFYIIVNGVICYLFCVVRVYGLQKQMCSFMSWVVESIKIILQLSHKQNIVVFHLVVYHIYVHILIVHAKLSQPISRHHSAFTVHFKKSLKIPKGQSESVYRMK